MQEIDDNSKVKFLIALLICSTCINLVTFHLICLSTTACRKVLFDHKRKTWLGQSLRQRSTEELKI